MKHPVYNPIAMGDLITANAYGKAWSKIHRKERIKRCQENRDRIFNNKLHDK